MICSGKTLSFMTGAMDAPSPIPLSHRASAEMASQAPLNTPLMQQPRCSEQSGDWSSHWFLRSESCCCCCSEGGTKTGYHTLFKNTNPKEEKSIRGQLDNLI